MLVERGRGVIDRVRDEEPKRHRARLGQVDRPSERISEQVATDPLPLSSSVYGEAREQHARNRKSRQPSKRLDIRPRDPLDECRGEGEVASDSFAGIDLVDRQERPSQQVLVLVPPRVALQVLGEGRVLVFEARQEWSVPLAERLDTKRHGAAGQLRGSPQSGAGATWSGSARDPSNLRRAGVGEKPRSRISAKRFTSSSSSMTRARSDW